MCPVNSTLRSRSWPAQTVDTKLIKSRMSIFEKAHRDYAAAHARVQAVETRLGGAQIRLGELDVTQDAAVDALARALIVDGKPRSNPFTGLVPLAPAALMKLAFAEEVKAIDQLVSRIKLTKGLSSATLSAAQAATKAARAVEQGLADINKCQAAVRAARHARDAVASTFAIALAALKRGARAAADDGASNLYAALFDRPSRPNGKSAKLAPAPAAAPAPNPTS